MNESSYVSKGNTRAEIQSRGLIPGMNEEFRQEAHADYPKIFAWDLHEEDERRSLSIFRLDDGGAKHVYGVTIPISEVSHTNSVIEKEGHRIGQYDRWAPFVWQVSDHEIVVWDRERTYLRAHEGLIRIIYDVQCKSEDIRYVYAFADSTMVSRGVRAMLKNGDHQSLVIDISRTASLDPTYNRNMLLVETAWAAMIGQAIAKWAKVPYERQI